MNIFVILESSTSRFEVENLGRNSPPPPPPPRKFYGSATDKEIKLFNNVMIIQYV